MRAHYLQHVPFEGLGSMGPWLEAEGFEITRTAFFEFVRLPDPREVDFLIVMGGPMSIHDEDLHPWLVDEKRFIREVIGAGKPVLGVCLGAQLIASVAGARVYPNAHKEIGWFLVRAVETSDGPEVFRMPPSIGAFHWHGETFDLPPGAVHLARSEACGNQAFQLGPSVIGLQFHLETTPESARKLAHHCRDELRIGPYVQSEDVILGAAPESYQAIHSVMAGILSFLTRSLLKGS